MNKILTVGLLALVTAFGLCSLGIAEEGITDTEIVLGSILDLSGPVAFGNKMIKNGLEMRAREINEAGGIHGRKIKLIVEDSGYDPKKAVMATNKMIGRDKVFAFISNFGTPTSLACLPITTRKKIPALFPAAMATGFTKPFNRYSFSIHAPYSEFCRGAVRFFVKEKSVKRVGCLYQDDEFGKDNLDGTKKELAALNMKLAAAESFKRGATDFSSQIAKLKKSGVELVIMGSTLRATVGALKEARKIGWKVDMCGTPAAFTKFVPLLAKKAGFSVDGFYCAAETPYPYADSEIPFVREWFKRHQKWFGAEPDVLTAVGYITMWVFEQAAKKAGKDLTRENIIDTIETIQDLSDPFGSAPFSFSKTSHLGQHQLFITQIKDGKYVKISDFMSFE